MPKVIAVLSLARAARKADISAPFSLPISAVWASQQSALLRPKVREDVLAFRHFPLPHWMKACGTNLLERLNAEMKRRTRVVEIIPNDAAITHLVGAVLLDQVEHWQLEGRRMFSAESMRRNSCTGAAAQPNLAAGSNGLSQQAARPQVNGGAAPLQAAAALLNARGPAPTGAADIQL